MKKRSFVISVFCLSLLTGCQQSEDGLELEEEYPVFIEASIGGVASRYTGSEPNDAAFANGDKIGLAYKVGTDAPTSFVEWTFNKPVGGVKF